MPSPRKRLVCEPGARIHGWTLLYYVPGKQSRKHPEDRVPPRWMCRCTCGVEREVLANNLAAGLTHNCGHDAPVHVKASLIRRLGPQVNRELTEEEERQVFAPKAKVRVRPTQWFPTLPEPKHPKPKPDKHPRSARRTGFQESE